MSSETGKRPRGTGQVYQRAGSTCWWFAYYHKGKKVRESSESTDRKAAERKLRDRLKEVHADELGARPFVGPKAEKITVGELLDALVSDYELTKKMTPQVRSHLKPIRTAFGDRLAVAVTAEQVDAYIGERLALGYANGSVNRGLEVLGRAFRLAIRRRHLTTMPDIRSLDESANVRRGFFEREQFEAVVLHLPNDLQDFVRFAYQTGWRKGEIAALLWANVDGRAIILPAEESKNRRPRKVPIVGKLKAIIERRRVAKTYTNAKGIPTVSRYVFHRNGDPIKEFRKSWQTACMQAMLDGFTGEARDKRKEELTAALKRGERPGVLARIVHDFCRTAIRNMVRAGVAEVVAMQISGRRTRAIFDRYNIVNEKDMADPLERTDAYVSSLPAAPKVRALPVMREAHP